MMEKQLKLVVVGNAGVGKTSLLFAYTENRLIDGYTPTTVENWALNINIEEKRYTINVFDTGGKEEYVSLRRLTYHLANAYIICFSMVDRKSLEACSTLWISELSQNVASHVPIILVGTKDDLIDGVDSTVRVDPEEARRVAQSIGAVTFLQCSSLTLRGVKRVFDESLLAALGRTAAVVEEQRICCLVI
ncbi:hypothetical protein AB6A40_007126 [Gnathostoma spinigerum]|uniref:Uncharacterized protein n=1 Tax=Gnathostoma spinigerum TaxID=75299 RepID=A0ABD6EUQ6_9BILA